MKRPVRLMKILPVSEFLVGGFLVGGCGCVTNDGVWERGVDVSGGVRGGMALRLGGLLVGTCLVQVSLDEGGYLRTCVEVRAGHVERQEVVVNCLAPGGKGWPEDSGVAEGNAVGNSGLGNDGVGELCWWCVVDGDGVWLEVCVGWCHLMWAKIS